MADLFEPDGPQVFSLPDADLRLFEAADIGAVNAWSGEPDYHHWLHWLVEQTPWRSEEITLFGKRYLQPRLTAWYGDQGCGYRYSGLLMEPLRWTAPLLQIKQKLEDLCESRFNSVLLNYYRDQNDSMGMHSDDERELGPEPVIASLSLGATRTLSFKHKHRRDVGVLKLPLNDGSVLLMRGSTQACWKHGIAKERQPCGPRINLTFRQVMSGD